MVIFLTLSILAIAWGVAVWREPKRMFPLLPILLPAYVIRTHIGPLPTTALELVILATAIGWLANRRMTGVREAWARARPWMLPVGLWILAGVIGVFVSPVKLQALGLFRAYFIEPMLVFIIGLDLIRAKEDRERLWRGFGEVTILLAIWAVVQMLTGWSIPHPWDAVPGRRATGPFPFPNALALFVTPVAALAVTRVVGVLNDIKATGRGRASSLHQVWWDIGVVVGGGVAILCAQSDGGMVALAAATFVALLMHKHSRRFAVEIAIVVIIAAAFVPSLNHYVTNVLSFKDWSGMVRTVIWKESFNMLKDHPIFGAGLAAFPTVIVAYHKALWMEIFQYPHNILLNLWSETGLLGIAAFGWITWNWIVRSRKTLAMSLPVITAILVHGLVDVPYFKNDLAVAFWLLILLITVYETQTAAG